MAEPDFIDTLRDMCRAGIMAKDQALFSDLDHWHDRFVEDLFHFLIACGDHTPVVMALDQIRAVVNAHGNSQVFQTLQNCLPHMLDNLIPPPLDDEFGRTQFILTWTEIDRQHHRCHRAERIIGEVAARERFGELRRMTWAHGVQFFSDEHAQQEFGNAPG